MTTYYRLFRIGELTYSPHAVKACNVHIGHNKNKFLFVLKSSKTHGEGDPPQLIKIQSSRISLIDDCCPFNLLRQYIRHRPGYLNPQENFFVFADRTCVKPEHYRKILKTGLKEAGFDYKLYTVHSFHLGRSIDLLKFGVSVETIRKLGRWKSNAVYVYLK